MKRRDFLRGAGYFIVGASLAGVPGCGGGNNNNPDAGAQAGTFVFPQGVASGDPRNASVVLWTRAAKADGTPDDVSVTVDVASDAGFATIVANKTITATAASDHTVRVLVTGLASGTAYYYRFTAGVDAIKGQTMTAPDATADVQVNIAWVTCQDYQAGTYGAYRQMLIDDAARAAADQIHFVCHVGDVIYETVGADFQKAIDANMQFVTVKNRDGSDRAVPPLPSGGGKKAGNVFAQTIDDYRALYKTFLSDPDFIAARARWPFIHIWSDHEFTNDCWQSMANYDNAKSLDEPSQDRRYVGNQAFFEYMPLELTGAGSPAHDFMPATPPPVSAPFTTPTADNFVDEPNNAAAVGSLAIYRSFRWGKHVELFMTDTRGYRSDHAIPEDLTATSPLFFDPRNVLIKVMVDTLDQGMTANNNNPPATVAGFNNPRTTSPVGTMLGKDQKAWFKSALMGSTATWKVWGNEVLLSQFFIKNPTTGPGAGLLFADRIMDGDGWDGYPTERNELMKFVKDNNIQNLLVLTGDIHAHYACVVMDDFDAATPAAVATELCTAGISSNSQFSFFESATRPASIPPGLRALITVDATSKGGPKYQPNMNMLLLHGSNAAAVYGQTLDIPTAIASADPTINPWLKYADSDAQGYGYVKVSATGATGTLVTINRPTAMASDAGPGVLRTATFTIPAGNPGGMSAPTMTGTKPFPMT
jgi:alkaline phosphatase D